MQSFIKKTHPRGYILLLIFSLSIVVSCHRETEISSVDPVNWEKRKTDARKLDNLVMQSTYLPVYSQIYQRTEKHLYNLTTTVSIRNISTVDSVFISRADYYNTEGNLIRTYFNFPVFVRPLETIEIVIDETDTHGGTGGNFIFEWATRSGIQDPLFEAVMISTTGQQGLSFTTRGVKRL